MRRFAVSFCFMGLALDVFHRAWARFQMQDLEACVALLGCFAVLAAMAVPERRPPSKPDKMAGA
jgi:hypothetical protein